VPYFSNGKTAKASGSAVDFVVHTNAYDLATLYFKGHVLIIIQFSSLGSVPMPLLEMQFLYVHHHKMNILKQEWN